jgi:hypothetical protein
MAITVTVPGVLSATLKWNGTFVPMGNAGGGWTAQVPGKTPGPNRYIINVLTAADAQWAGTIVDNATAAVLDTPGGIADDAGHDKCAGAC